MRCFGQKKNENKKTKLDEKKLFLKKLFCWNTYKKYEQQWWREIFIQKQKKKKTVILTVYSIGGPLTFLKTFLKWAKT